MRYTCVTPFVYQPYMDACAETCRFDDASWMRWDNTMTNLGIQRVVNMGIDKMFRDDADWLIYMSTTMRFGEPGGLDFIDHLEQNPTYAVIEAQGYTTQSIWGWHLIAFSRKTVEDVGRWDENFHPAYYDDLDYSLRFQKRYAMDFVDTDGPDRRAWEKLQIQAEDAGAAHGLKLAGVKIDPWQHQNYFRQKWGRHPDHPYEPSFDRPYNDPQNPVSFWPSVTIEGVTGTWNMPLPEDVHQLEGSQ